MIVVLVACSSSPPKKTSGPAVGSTTEPVEAPHMADARPAPPPPPPPDAPPDAPKCPPQNPKGCPVAEPNVNRPCDVKGAECVYDDHCCHEITYVCAKNKHFEAHVQRCN